MKAAHLLASLALTLVTAPALAGGMSIAYYSLIVSGPSSAEPLEWNLFFSIGDPQQPDPAGYLTAPTYDITDFFNGTTHILAGDFASAAAELTNGVDSTIYFGSTVPGESDHIVALTESAAFAPVPGLIGPDLTGFTLTHIEVFGSSFQFGDTYEATFEFSFYGQPIPAPGALGVFAMAGVGGMRRR